VTEGGVDEAGVFHKIYGIDDARLEEIFAREALAAKIRKELLSKEWAAPYLIVKRKESHLRQNETPKSLLGPPPTVRTPAPLLP